MLYHDCSQRIILFCLIVLAAVNLTACNTPLPSNTPEVIPSSTHHVKPQRPDPPFQEFEEKTPLPTTTLNPNHEAVLIGTYIKEEDFTEDLDVNVLVSIATEIQSLVAEIGEKERADPKFVLQGKWNEYFRSSEQYNNLVLELGLQAVKPAYYITYKSPQSGLYEYILASAIDEITGYDYAVTESYGWSSSKQFLEMYNEKVLKTLTSFSEILENQSLSQVEKVKQIRSLGIFAVAPLLNEIDTSSSNMSAESLEACLWGIIEDHTGEDVNLDLESWRSENEQTYQNIIGILE